MTWTVRHIRKIFTEDCVRCLYGGTTLDIDYLEENSFDLKDIDEFALIYGYPVGSRLLYVYREPGMGLAFGLKPLLSADDVVKFRELTFREKCLEIYIDASPNSELCDFILVAEH
ncbi:hypothetical protein LIER_19511 [Lithospermum erythrorhizon]|uniref:Uncharacterized protein n=1 Tax=Lithospermum erythrorhizon TaxID=34254 RepID=A0AAV3QHZ0_LITER